MDHYLDMRVLPDPEFTEATLMAALFAKLHRALGARAKGDIGVSFPEHGVTPGGLLRLHGSRAALQELEAMRWRVGLSDYCQCAAINAIPKTVQWRTVSRVQVKSNPQRLLRRAIRRGSLTEAQADARLLSMSAQRSALPYLSIKSLSTGQHFRLFIRHGEIQANAVAGTFSGYGLSAETTIPWF